MAWTESRVETARSRWNEGCTASEIARLLGGVTRNAVIGKLNRLGLFRDETAKREPRPRKLRQRKAVNPNRVMGAMLAARYEKRLRMKAEPIEPLQIPFLERESGQCRAITDTTAFAQRVCGHPIEDAGVYCPHHSALYYQPRKAPAR